MSGYGSEDKQEQMTQTQKKTFTRWMNYFLSERLLKVDDLFKDLKDGIKLIHLLELISSKKLPKFEQKPRIALHELGNINISLQFLKDEGIKLVNIDADDINKGVPKLILGLIWTIILRYQIQQGGDGASPKQELLEWVNRQVAPYKEQGLCNLAEDFTKSFQDGKILSALADSLAPGLINCKALGDPMRDVQNAMQKSEDSFGIPQLVDASDMVNRPDEHSNMTYIAYFRNYLENEGKRRAEAATKAPRKENCFAKGKGVEGGFARRPLPFTIHSRTVNDAPVTGKYMQDFKVVVTGPAGEVPAELKNNNDGTFFCKYIAPVSGDYKVAIDLLGNDKRGESHGPIKGSVYSLFVREPSDPSKSWAEGPGLERTIEGRPALFTVHAIDKDGKGVPGDNVQVEVKLIEKAPDAPGATGDVVAEVKDNGDGTYSAKYEPKVPGKYRVNVTINGDPIRDMPKDVICGRAVDASKSTAQGPGVTPGEPRVGLDAPFTVIARDKLGNKIPAGGSEVKVTITGPSGPVECDVKDDNSGVYQCNYLPPVPGDYVVDVKLEGQGVKDNPFRLNIKKPADPSKSYAEGPGLEHAFDNRPAKFKVHALDEDGKPVSGEPVVVTVKPKHGGEPKDVQVTDNGDGTYDVAYIADKPGDYIVDTQIRGEHIKDMPKEVRCYPGVDASKTIVEGPGVTGGFAGRDLPFVIKSMDKEGKPVTVGGDDYKVQVTGPDGQPVPVDLKDNGDGTYNGMYTPNKPGDYKVMINVNRQKAPVGKSPYIAKVRPGAAPGQSFAVGRGWQEAYDCLPAKFTIHAKDIEGKPVPGEIVKVIMRNKTTPQQKAKLEQEISTMDEYLRNRKINKAKKLEAERKKKGDESKREAEAKGEKLPEIRIEAGGDVPVEVRDNGDGTYAAEYVAIEPGTYQIDVLIGPHAEHIKESPKTVPVHLAKPTVVFWKHTHAKQKEDLKELRQRLQEAEALLSKHGLSLDQ